MRKLNCIYVAAMSLMLAACTKENQGIPFEKGQEVTFGISAPGECGTKVTSELNGTSIDFKWQEGDKISVKVGESYASFDMIELSADNKIAKFKGKMPASGDEFTVSYPVGGVDLSSQTYQNNPFEPLPHDKMLLAGDGTLSSDGKTAEITTISAQYAVLLLNLWGTDTKVTKIVVTNTSSSTTYTLNCGDGVTVGEEDTSPTSFRVIVPTGIYAFTVAVYGTITGKTIPNNLICTLERTKVKEFKAGYAYKMNTWKLFYPNYPGTNEPPVELNGVTWAPVNCGYEAASGDYKGYPYGKLYQWGRKYGQGYKGLSQSDTYEDADWPGKAGGNQTLVNISSAITPYPDGAIYNGKFYYPLDNWYGGSDANTLWSSTKTNYDPCPSGWRVPTISEYSDNLLGGANVLGSGWDPDKKGYWFNGTASPSVKSGKIFFPAAGCRNPKDASAGAFDRGATGGYWSSTVVDENDVMNSRYLTFADTYAGKNICTRSYGFSVRCVLDVKMDVKN